ncbi:FAD-dependent oxidoreductase, partial [Pseudomonas sp. BGM005]|nr:FAD-dependent oxidoreductase [Pseudomonas sp. BG5]
GAGPGGYVAAVKAAQLGLRVGVVEERYWGGVCLNVGCVPAKTLLRNAEVAHIVTEQAELFGLGGDITVDYGAAYRRSRKVSADRAKGVHYLMHKNGISEYSGRGSFTGPRSLTVTAEDTTQVTLTFDRAI